MNMNLYPLKFQPIFKDKIWGGTSLKTFLNKEIPSDTCGESWELSGVKNNFSIVKNGYHSGKNLITIIVEFGENLLGKRIYAQHKTNFPLLFKFIDSKDDLSLQVHPDNTVALKKHDCFGKNEMWYIVHAEENSKIISGFKSETSKEAFAESVKNNTVLSSLNNTNVEHKDIIYVPSGRIHTIGKGLLIAEIQQSSDITYRVYDFDRIDKDGNKRDLHIQDALDVIDFSVLENPITRKEITPNQLTEVVKDENFIVSKIDLTNTISLDTQLQDSFEVLMCIAGNAEIHWDNQIETISLGETVMIPACLGKYKLKGNFAEILHTYIPEK